MENVLTVAAYICGRYRQEHGSRIDEMKLHKMMYFAQREALIQTGEPLFDAQFRGWKYGPVLKEIRASYQNDTLPPLTREEAQRLDPILNPVFADYAQRDSWSLSRLTHGEISWKKSRKGLTPDAASDNPMELADIRQDADRMKQRREMLDRYGLL